MSEKLLENTEGGDFFVYKNELYFASEDMDKNIRVRDGKIVCFDIDVLGERTVRVVRGCTLIMALGRLKKWQDESQEKEMEVVESMKECKGAVTNALLDVILQHTTLTLYNAMMFMTDKAQDGLVASIIKQKEIIQSGRMKPDETEP
jgi:hypothetical protein